MEVYARKPNLSSNTHKSTKKINKREEVTKETEKQLPKLRPEFPKENLKQHAKEHNCEVLEHLGKRRVLKASWGGKIRLHKTGSRKWYPNAQLTSCEI